MIRKLIVAIAIVLLTSSCAAVVKQTITETKPDGTTVTTEIVETETSVYHKSIAQHSIAESNKAIAQAEAIKEVSVSGLSADAQALLIDRKLDAIASLETKPYMGEKPTNAYDVAETAVKEGRSWVSSIVMGTVAYKGLDTMKAIAERPTTSIEAGEGAQVHYEKHDNQAIASGGSQANAGAAGNTGPLRDVESESITSSAPGAGPSGTEAPAVLTEEYCNTLGMTLRDSQGVCITYADKVAIEEAAAREASGE
jgi:uncharacterized protein YceK